MGAEVVQQLMLLAPTTHFVQLGQAILFRGAGLEVVWPHLCMVNLKNAFWQRTTGPEAEVATWRHYWTSGRQGLASWPRVIAELRRRGYSGTVCLPAEYTDEEAVDRLIVEDLAFAQGLFA